MDVPVKKGVGAQGLVEVVHGPELRRVIEIGFGKNLLENLYAFFGKHDGIGLLVFRVERFGILSLQQIQNRRVGLVILGSGLLGRS